MTARIFFILVASALAILLTFAVYQGAMAHPWYYGNRY